MVEAHEDSDRSVEIASVSNSSLKKGETAVAEDTLRDAQGQRIYKRSMSDIFAVICSGFALISDGYQNNLMTMVNLVYAEEYPDDYDSTMKTRVSNALLIGEIVGQVLIGLTCDYMGRKWALTATTAMIVVGGILATAAHGTTTLGMLWMVTIARGLIGVGCGGEYPASSSAASESANEVTKKRGMAFVLVTNLPLAFGGPFALIVFLIVWCAASGYAHLSTVWRVCFGLGCVWPLTVFYFRIKMATSRLYSKGAMNKKVPYWLAIKFYWKRIIGTCGAWFLYDFVTFPNGVFSGTIISGLFGSSVGIKTVAEWQLLLGVIQLPGVFVGAFLVDVIGRKYTMMIGFTGYIIFGLIIGCAFEQLSHIIPLFVVFYGLMNSLANLGPGNCLGLVSSESYATGIRGTAYGLSAAVGKAGAAIGTQVFTPIQDNLGKRWTFIIAGIIGVLGVVVTFFFIPHLREDDLMFEDQRFTQYLRENGWEGQIGREHSEADVEVTAQQVNPVDTVDVKQPDEGTVARVSSGSDPHDQGRSTQIQT